MKNIFVLPVLVFLISCGQEKKASEETEALETTVPSSNSEDATIEVIEISDEPVMPQAKIMFDIKLWAYVSDPDTEPTNVRAKPNGEIVAKLPQEYGYEVGLVGATGGWFLVSEIWSPDKDDGSYDEIRGFIHGSVLGVDTRNYGEEEIYLYEDPDDSSNTVATINSQVELTLKNTNSDGSWVNVRWSNAGSTKEGWIQRDWLCGSLVTNCS